MSHSVHRFRSIKEISPDAWQTRICPESFPFGDYRFLSALEDSGVLRSELPWEPHVLTVGLGDSLDSASVLYEKSHSYGEYIFDWAWANAYAQHGLAYYPKLVSGVPFTPATGPKLMGPGEGAPLVQEALALAEERRASSLHYLFVTPEEVPVYRDQGLMIRHSFQYHWKNQNYSSFDDFLNTLKSRKRKQILKERRTVDSNLEVLSLSGADLDDEAAKQFTGFYQNTIRKMGAIAYLNEAFFAQVFRSMGDSVTLLVAKRGDAWVAASLFFFRGDTLFGRYWGSTEEGGNLHFEICYYRGIEIAIERGLTKFEAGAQGEHKLARGFLPALTYSAHYIAHPQFRGAIEDFVEAEKKAIADCFQSLADQSPYRKGSTAE